jgi:hypothetical protein
MLSQLNLIQTFISYFFKNYFNMSLSSTPTSSQVVSSLQIFGLKLVVEWLVKQMDMWTSEHIVPLWDDTGLHLYRPPDYMWFSCTHISPAAYTNTCDYVRYWSVLDMSTVFCSSVRERPTLLLGTTSASPPLPLAWFLLPPRARRGRCVATVIHKYRVQ